MTKPTKIVINCETKVQEIIELTDEEIAQMEADRVKYEAERVAKAAEDSAKAVAKAELLERLGITADEAKLLLA